MMNNFQKVLEDESSKTDLNTPLSSLMSMMPKDGTVSTSLSRIGTQHLFKIEIVNSQACLREEVLDDHAQDAIDRAIVNVKHRMQGLRRVSIGMDGNSYVNLVNLLGSHA